MQKYIDLKYLISHRYLQHFSPLWPPRTALLHSNLRQRDLEFAQLDLDFVQRDLDFVQLDLELQPT